MMSLLETVTFHAEVDNNICKRYITKSTVG
jgi:hypothetical protein